MSYYPRSNFRENREEQREIGQYTRVPQASAISLDTDLYKAVALPLADRFHSKSRRISMCANHSNGASRLIRDDKLAGSLL